MTLDGETMDALGYAGASSGDLWYSPMIVGYQTVARAPAISADERRRRKAACARRSYYASRAVLSSSI